MRPFCSEDANNQAEKQNVAFIFTLHRPSFLPPPFTSPSFQDCPRASHNRFYHARSFAREWFGHACRFGTAKTRRLALGPPGFTRFCSVGDPRRTSLIYWTERRATTFEIKGAFLLATVHRRPLDLTCRSISSKGKGQFRKEEWLLRLGAMTRELWEECFGTNSILGCFGLSHE